MIRSLHKIPGLFAALLLVTLALSGVTLSVYPAIEKVSAPAQSDPGLTVGDLADRVVANYPGVEQIRRSPSGLVTALYFTDGQPGAVVIDPATGKGVSDYNQSRLRRWLTNLHRSLFLNTSGRLGSAAGALTMLIMSISGLLLTKRRVGGWRKFFSRLRGPFSGRLHVEFARFAVVGLLLSSVTGLWMTASVFGYVPDAPPAPAFPMDVTGETGFAPGQMPLLQGTPVANLRELIFPYPDDPTDVFSLATNAGQGFLDQGNGSLLVWENSSTFARVSEFIYMLHTGQGAWALGLILGLMALCVPVMAVTGFIMWLLGRRSRPRIRRNAGAAQADTVVLVGSEGGSTWGFAATLHAALTEAGQSVHTAALSRFAPDRYRKAKRLIVLSATYGDGGPPASAKGFLERLGSVAQAPDLALAILGFGDRKFPDFCGYANSIAGVADKVNWPRLMPMDTVDRQSSQDFARWGRALGAAMGLDLELSHQPAIPRTRALTLVSRRDYGAEVQSPTAILRFALPRRGLWSRLIGRGMPRFAGGDLLGIVPEGSPVPRFYSLASSRRDGFVEVCVKRHLGGLCSGQLLDMEPGDTVAAFIRRNPEFRPARGRKPVILIGAGTGIGPLAGFTRANRPGRKMHMFFGARHPDSDFLYGDELSGWQNEGRLATLTTAFSRTKTRTYVQDALRQDAARVVGLIEEGAQVLVCGGRDMAIGVADAFAEILAPSGLTPAMLKAEGRYAEDVY